MGRMRVRVQLKVHSTVEALSGVLVLELTNAKTRLSSEQWLNGWYDSPHDS